MKTCIHSRLLLALLVILIAPASLWAASPVVISEFMTANTRTLADEDGQFSDWIELQNVSSGTVNLEGWRLTDDPLRGVPWIFPATNLPPGGLLIVFASGKDRAVAGRPLHMNFSLEDNGEYLALLEPDGQTLASEFAPYPPQRADVAYGTGQQVSFTSLIAPGAMTAVRVPVDASLSDNWTGGAANEPFDDSPAAGWLSGRTGAGFDADGAASLLVGNALIARPFTDTASGSIFVLASSPFAQGGILTRWSMYSDTVLTITPLLLRLDPAGGNYSIAGIGRTRTSTANGHIQSFDFQLQSGSAAVGPNLFFGWKDGSNGGNNTGVAPFTDNTSESVRWFQQHTSFTAGENLGSGQPFSRTYSFQATVGVTLTNLIALDLQSAMRSNNASAFMRVPFVVNDPAALSLLTLSLRYEDGFLAYVNGVEVARRNAPGGPLPFNAAAASDRPKLDATAAETIDITAGLTVLRAGTNVFALHGLNDHATNGAFLLLPELTGVTVATRSNRFLFPATPGGLNAPGVAGFVEDTQFSVGRGFYTSPFQVAITTTTPGAQIYFTTNASIPSPTNANARLYTGPILISRTTILRAAAYRDDFEATDIDTQTYLFVADVLRQPRNPPGFPSGWAGIPADYEIDTNVVNTTLPGYSLTDALLALPSISVTMDPEDVFGAARGIYYNSSAQGAAWERAASIELIHSDNHPGFQVDCGARIAGASSRNHAFVPKHSFRLSFKDRFGPRRLDYPLFPDTPVRRFDQLVLNARSTDSWPVQDGYVHQGNLRWDPKRGTYQHDQWMRDAQRDLGRSTPHGRYVHLYLNGLYWGLYNLTERADDGFNSEYFGGPKEEYDVIKDYAELDSGNLDAWNEMMSLASAGLATEAAYQRIQGNHPDGTRNTNYPVYVDVDNLIDYLILHIFAGAEDWAAHNWWGARRRGPDSTGFHFFVWDQEISNDSLVRMLCIFGQRFEEVDSFNSPAFLYDRLRRNETFQWRFIDRVQKHLFNGGALAPENNRARWAARAAEIDQAIVGESARWGDYRVEPPRKREIEWLAEQNWIQNVYWLSNHSIALARFRRVGLHPALGAPAFSQHGGSVPAGYSLAMAHTNASGVILFTLDGSDPRQPGGAVGAGAQSYPAPMAMNAQTFVRARVKSGTNWSALVEATFHPPQDLSRLLVTEIMFHPPAFGANDGDDVEFLELKNTGTVALSLGGLRFTSGIDFTFPANITLAPGAFFVLTRNAALFAAKYPGATAHGVYAGRLDNGGETLTLSHPLGGVVFSLSYGDSAPWPLAADGFGFSLVPVTPDATPGLASNWRASADAGGSPGVEDPSSSLAPVRINEVLSHSETGGDWIELFNPAPAAVDIGGWFLTDDARTPIKYRIPPGTMIGPVGFVTFDEAEFNPTPGAHHSFSLSSRGDEVYLFSGDANTNLTGYSHGFAFGAAGDGSTFGRHVLSTSDEEFPCEQAPTRNSPNLGPRVGPVVISEIMYHPDTGEDEFVELRNITPDSVALFDTLRPTNTWRLNGLAFTFPTGLTLGPNQLLLLVGIDPAVFRTRYNVPPGVPVLGPFAGVLQDSGERLDLQRPDVPDTNGVAYIAVDAVRYNDRTPWPPAADGSGPSLQRRSLTAFGNDPANWEAANATPGYEFNAGAAPVIVTAPQGQTVQAGQLAMFTVTAIGLAPLSFQWRYRNDPIPGATNAMLVLANVQLSEAGDYSVVVFNNAGSVASAPATLTVIQPPLFLAHPVNQFVRPGSNATFSVLSTGNGILRYQWQFNGINLDSATNAVVTITNVQFGHEGLYRVLVTDAYSTVPSAIARLAVLVVPMIVQLPVSQTVVAGGEVTFSVAISGHPAPFRYEWRRGSTPVATVAASDNRNNFVTLNATAAGFVLAGNMASSNYICRLIITNAATVPPGLSTNFTVTVLADTDGDGLSDLFEQTHFGNAISVGRNEDSDGDGMLNWQEQTSGTDPTRAASYLKVESISSTGMSTLTFGAISNRTYAVQFAEAFAPASWSTLVSLPARSTNWKATITDPAPGTNRFYRLVTPQR